MVIIFKLEFGSCFDLFWESPSRQNLFKSPDANRFGHQKQVFHGCFLDVY